MFLFKHFYATRNHKNVFVKNCGKPRVNKYTWLSKSSYLKINTPSYKSGKRRRRQYRTFSTDRRSIKMLKPIENHSKVSVDVKTVYVLFVIINNNRCGFDGYKTKSGWDEHEEQHWELYDKWSVEQFKSQFGGFGFESGLQHDQVWYVS